MLNLRTLRFVVSAGCSLAAASALAAPTSRLVVVHGGGKSKLTYTSSDTSAGIEQGAGTDPAAISATVDVHIDAASGHYELPAGAFDGTSGWTDNSDGDAKWKSRGTGPRSFAITDGKRVKLVAPGFGLVGSTTTITVAIAIDDDGETSTHCVTFTPQECSYRSSEKQRKVACKGGTPDPTCGLPPTTTSTSTAPPPSTTSTTLVYAQAPDCCQGSGECRNGSGFTLLSNLNFFCQGALPGSISKPGNVCGDDGQCHVYPLPEPKSLCCERPSDCYDTGGPVGLGDTVWFFRNTCYGNGGLAYQDAVCGVSGNCEAD